ncbi:hypothetical protein KM043_012252 [Ampulex compressa]|nr:hypothetical protein KM043_012252 [Ampulex compressa]
MPNTFLYFAYGSNMLLKRLHINNPTAVFKNIGCLKNFRLDFMTYSERWHGASATIVPTLDSNSCVWGVVWELNECNLETLDYQEGVADQIYFPRMVYVETPDEDVFECRVYQQCNKPQEYTELGLLPIHRRPSPLYIETLLKGAHENHLPTDYVNYLKDIPHNGYEGDYEIGLPLQRV